MKKSFILFFILFVFILKALSIDVYKIDSVSVRINNSLVNECTKLYVWQSWQKTSGKVIINNNDSTIILNIISENKYKYNTYSIYRDSESTLIYDYIIKNKAFISLYVLHNEYYLYIYDMINKIEVYYKINKVT